MILMGRFFTNKAAFISALTLAAVFLAAPHHAHAGFWDLITTGAGFLEKVILAPFELLVLPLAATLMWISGILLDAAINFSLHTAYIVNLSPAINMGWIVVRDLCNLMFIFGLIYLSLRLITGNEAGWKAVLTKLIVAAILLNFSLFFTKALIDVSNVFGNWLYGGIQKTLEYNSVDTSNKTTISGLITARMGVLELWGISPTGATRNASDANSSFLKSLTDPSKSFIGIFLRLAILLSMIYIFLYGAILFISRSITLLFLAVFSPIVVLGEAFPKIAGEYSSMWKKELEKALIFPVAFLLMLYISLQFINSLGVLELPALKDGSAPMGISVSQYFQYFIIIFLLQATLSVSKSFSGTVGKALGGFAESLSKLATTAVTTYATGGLAAGAAFAGRRIIGSRMATLAANGAIKDMAAGKVGETRAGRFVNQIRGKANLAVARAGAKASFDIRATDAVKNATSAFEKTTGVELDLGKPGGKDGYKGMVKAAEEKENKFAKEFGDDPADIIRRVAYAESQRNSMLKAFTVGSKNAKKIGDKIEGEALTTAAKEQTNKAKKDAQKIKNLILFENLGAASISDALKKDDPRVIDNAVLDEMNRIKRAADASEKDEKNRLAYNRYQHEMQRKIADDMTAFTPEGQNAIDEMARLDKEYEESSKNLSDTEKEAVTKAVEKIRGEREGDKAYLEKLEAALKQAEISEKKKAAEEIVKHINENRIGKKSKGDEPATGLFAKLDEAKKNAEAAQKEDENIYGKESGDEKKGGGGGGEEKKDKK